MPKILFAKTLPVHLKSTEEAALEVLNDPKYDAYPQYIDKHEIQSAFDKYGYKLNPFNSSIYANTLDSPNIEGHFMAKNIPEINSVVMDGTCTKDNIHHILERQDNITHIALSVYAHGLDNAVNVINIIQNDYPEKKLFLGGTGSCYPRLHKMVPPRNICRGEGISWLREKFELSQVTGNEIEISTVMGDTTIFPTNMKTAYIVTQTGCPFSCDFCITSKMFQYNPFTRSAEIIQVFEELLERDKKDKFVYICEPNACYPEREWKKVFNHFIDYKGSYDNYLHIICLISLNHLKKFNLKKIQEKSRVRFFLVNYGIESTLGPGYKKNMGITNQFIKKIGQYGIISNHNFILGLPHHTKENIHLEIKRNLEYDSCWYFISTLKPIPTTNVYAELQKQGLMYGENLPPEFVYQDGFFPFEHPHLGGGFAALQYAFESYYKTEEKVIDVYSTFARTLLNAPPNAISSDLQKIIDLVLNLSEMNKTMFEPRMSSELERQYQENLDVTRQKYTHYQSQKS